MCKDSLYCESKLSREYVEITNIVHDVFRKSLIFYAIFIPQTAEEAYGYLEDDGAIMLETLPKPDENEIPLDPKWEQFFDLRGRVLVQLEGLKNSGEISNPTEATVEIPKEEIIEGIDLRKCLNVGEIRLGEELRCYRCELTRCERCRRHKVGEGELCERCRAFIEDIYQESI